jgi:hypothetical protein
VERQNIKSLESRERVHLHPHQLASPVVKGKDRLEGKTTDITYRSSIPSNLEDIPVLRTGVEPGECASAAQVIKDAMRVTVRGKTRGRFPFGDMARGEASGGKRSRDGWGGTRRGEKRMSEVE